MKLRTADRAGRREEENLIPLINVVFLLLIFFMLFARLAPPEALPVEPPLTRAERTAGVPELLLLVAADGRLALHDESFDIAELSKRLAPYLASEPSPVVTVKADAALRAEQLLDVLDALRAVGVERLILLGAMGVP